MQGLYALLVLLALVVIVVALVTQRQKQSDFEQAIRSLGLTWKKGGLLTPSAGEGARGGMGVRISSVNRNERAYTRFEMSGRLPSSFQLRPQKVTSYIGSMFLGDDVTVGDGGFDGSVVAQGDATEIRARLNARARHAVLAAVSAGARYERGTFALEHDGLITDPARLEDYLHVLYAAAEALAEPPGGAVPLPDRLRDIALNDPVRRVQEVAFAQLCSEFPNRPQTGTVAKEFCTSPHASLRLSGALALGSEGAPVLEAILLDPVSTEDQQIRAMQGLGAAARHDPSIVPRIRELAARTSGHVLLEAFTILATFGAPPRLDVVCSAARASLPALRCVAAGCLVWFPNDPVAEAALIALLRPDEDSEVAAAAARSLARVGTVRAVEPLLELTKGLLRSGELKNAARLAVEAIQQRLGEATPGGLALVDEAALIGGLALVAGQGEAEGLELEAQAEVAAVVGAAEAVEAGRGK